MSVRPAESLLPLADIRIIDFSWSLPGPYATHMLADLGATVEVVDLVGRPDIFRMLPPLAGDASYAWDYVNQNKLRRSVDHRDSAAVAAFHGEIAGYDVLVEQFRPGAMEAWGLGYASLAAIHPGLIYCSITGFGQNGACSGRAGHDINYMALSGVAHGLRGADGVPALSALPFADMAGGSLHAAVGILAALQGRAKTGKGAHVDISMTDAMWSLNAYAGPAVLNGAGEAPGEGMLDGGCFYGFYRTSDGRWIAAGGLEPKFIDALFGALDRNDLADLARSADPAVQRTLRSELATIIQQRSFQEWCGFFAPLDVCVEPVLTVEEAASHPHFVSRRATESSPRGLRHFSAPIRFGIGDLRDGSSD